MISENLSDRDVVEFFRQIVDDGELSMTPMLRLVQRLARKEYADQFGAGTSLHTLCITGRTPVTGSITVAYLPHVELFQVRYVDRIPHQHETHKVAVSDAERLIDALLLRLWLRNADDNAQAGS